MIGSLRGIILHKKPTQILLEVSGVGYIVNISVNTFEGLPAEGQELRLYTELITRQDSLDLYGFSQMEEKEMFRMLLGVNGIGPKSAISLLSGIRTDDLACAIANANLSRIVAVPGIGKKTAERLLMELKDRVSKLGESLQESSASSRVNDAIAALITLGYNQKMADKAVRTIFQNRPEIEIEDLIKSALDLLNR